MRRNTLNYLIDLASLVVVLSMVGTGLVMRFVLPPGTGGRYGGGGLRLWGLGRHDWGGVHFWLAVALGCLLIVHVALHWEWVWGTTRRLVQGGREPVPTPSSRVQNLCGVGLLVAAACLFAALLWIAYANVEHLGGAGRGEYGSGRGAWMSVDDDEQQGHGGPQRRAGRQAGRGAHSQEAPADGMLHE